MASRRGEGKCPRCAATIAAVTTESAASPSLIFSSEDMVEKGQESLGQKSFGFSNNSNISLTILLTNEAD